MEGIWIATIIVASALTVALTVMFVRWFMGKQRRRRVPSGLIEEMNNYSDRFQQIVADMKWMSRHTEARRLRHHRIMENLREMNRLLQNLHDVFSEEVDPREPERLHPYRSDLSDELVMPESTPRIDDLLADDTVEIGDEPCADDNLQKFRKLPEITEDEIKSLNWDDLHRFDDGD